MAVLERNGGGFPNFWEETGLDSGSSDYFSHLVHGKWNIFPFYFEGKKKEANCRKMPLTCSVIEKIPEITIDVRHAMLRCVTHFIQGRSWHGFDGFSRTHQFSRMGSQTHQFLKISIEIHHFNINRL